MTNFKINKDIISIYTTPKYILVYVAAFIIACLEVLGELLDKLTLRNEGVEVALGGKQIAGFGIKAFLLWILIAVMLVWGWNLAKRAYYGKISSCPLFKSKFLVWLVIMVSWLPCFLAYFPGIYSYDGEPQLLQFTTKQFDNHHPVFHTLILGSCYDLGQLFQSRDIMIDGLVFYSVLQMMLLAFALASVVIYLAKRKAGKAILWISMALFCLFPVTPIMAISTTKDTFFTAVFVLGIIEILDFVNHNAKGLERAIGIVIYLVLCMLFRRNASYVFLIVLVVLVACYVVTGIKNRKFEWNVVGKSILICLLSVVIFNATEEHIMKVTNAVQGESAEALSIPLMQMARAYKSNQEEVILNYSEELYEYITPLGLSNYRPLISDGVKQGFNNELFAENKSDFISLYFRMFKDYPGSYIQAFLYMTKGDWQLMDNSHCEVYKDWWRNRTGYLITDATEVFALGFVTKTDILPGVRDVYEAIVTDRCYRAFAPLKLIFAPATYVFMVVLSGLAIVVLKKKRMFLIWMIVGLYLLTIIAGPCVLPRYIFPLMMLSPLLISMIFDKEQVK